MFIMEDVFIDTTFAWLRADESYRHSIIRQEIDQRLESFDYLERTPSKVLNLSQIARQVLTLSTTAPKFHLTPPGFYHHSRECS